MLSTLPCVYHQCASAHRGGRGVGVNPQMRQNAFVLAHLSVCSHAGFGCCNKKFCREQAEHNELSSRHFAPQKVKSSTRAARSCTIASLCASLRRSVRILPTPRTSITITTRPRNRRARDTYPNSRSTFPADPARVISPRHDSLGNIYPSKRKHTCRRCQLLHRSRLYRSRRSSPRKRL